MHIPQTAKSNIQQSARRTEHWCDHPLREKIREYFTKHNIHKAEGFIGFSKPDGSFPIKRTPAWCPDKEAEEEAPQNG